MQLSTAVRVRQYPGPQPAVAARPLLRDVSREVASCAVCTLRQICMPVDIQDAEAKGKNRVTITGWAPATDDSATADDQNQEA